MIDTMKQALEALKAADKGIIPGGIGSDERNLMKQSITALRQAIKESTLQEISDIGQEIEPVAYLMDGELFTAAEYQAIAEQGDGAQPLYAVSPKQEIEQTHTDHPLRHWDRTCPACLAEEKDADEWYEKALWGTSDMAHRSGGLSVDMSTKPENIDTSAERVHEIDKSIHVLDAIDRAYFAGKEAGVAERQWVSLTDDEIDYIWGISPADYEDKFAFPRAIEAKLKEKNN